MAKQAAEVLSIDGREVQITNPDKLYFSSQTQISKLDLVRYYLSIAPGALAGIRNRPIVLKRFVDGAEQPAFYQKRAPTDHPGWLELHPHPVRSQDLEHPDELRVDLDPGPGVSWSDVCAVALEVRNFLGEARLQGWPKTSGLRG